MTTLRVDDILQLFRNPQPLDPGGQKVVFTIDHPLHGKAVLKIGCYRSAAVLERIRREVQILSEIDSPYFPRNLDFKIVDDSRFYILEEFLAGMTLDHHFRAFNTEVVALALVKELVKALSILWERRVVHRDLKPTNIILSSDGPRIIDLGIARLLDGPSLTLSQAPWGPCTPDYASPEQLENRKREIDHRSDQFNLGILLALLVLNGEHPFSPTLAGEGESIPHNIVRGRWARQSVQSRLSPQAFIIVTKMLGREPFQRFRRYQDLGASLSQLLGETT